MLPEKSPHSPIARRGKPIRGRLILAAVVATAPLSLHGTELYDAEGFENPHFTIGDLDGQQSWTVSRPTGSVGAEVVDDDAIAYEGDRFVKLNPYAGNPPATQTELRLAGTPLSTEVRAYLDFRIRPVATLESGAEEMLSINGAQIALFRQTATDLVAEFYVFEPDNGSPDNGTWHPTGAQIGVDIDGIAASWSRMSIREDLDPVPDGLSNHFWDLWIDGVLVARDMPFDTNNDSDSGTYIVLGDVTHPVYLDNVRLDTDHPIGTDTDGDGITDAMEDALGTDRNTEDRASLADLESRYGASPGLADTDGDGLHDLTEIMNGTDPTDATDKLHDPSIDATLELDIDLGSATDSADWTARIYEQKKGGTVRRLRYTLAAPAGQLIAGERFRGRAAADYVVTLERAGGVPGAFDHAFDLNAIVRMPVGRSSGTRVEIHDRFDLLNTGGVKAIPAGDVLSRQFVHIRGLPAIEFFHGEFNSQNATRQTDRGRSFRMAGPHFPVRVLHHRSDREGKLGGNWDWEDNGETATDDTTYNGKPKPEFAKNPGGAAPQSGFRASFKEKDKDGEEGGGDPTTENTEAPGTEEPLESSSGSGPCSECCGGNGTGSESSEPASDDSDREGTGMSGGGAAARVRAAMMEMVGKDPQGGIPKEGTPFEIRESLAEGASHVVGGNSGWPETIFGENGVLFEIFYDGSEPGAPPGHPVYDDGLMIAMKANGVMVRRLLVENPGGDENRMTAREMRLAGNGQTYELMVRHEYYRTAVQTVQDGQWWHETSTTYERWMPDSVPGTEVRVAKTVEFTRELAESPWNIVETTVTTYDPLADTAVLDEKTTRTRFPWGERVTERARTDVAASETRTETLEYWDGSQPNAAATSLPKSHVREDGSWTYHEYDAEGRLAKSVTSYLDSPYNGGNFVENDNFSTVITYPQSDGDMDLVTKLGSKEIERRFLRHTVGQNDRCVEESVAQIPGVPHGHPGNRVTKTWYPKDSRKPDRVRHPDGTWTKYLARETDLTVTYRGTMDATGIIWQDGMLTTRSRDSSEHPWATRIDVYEGGQLEAVPWSVESSILDNGNAEGDFTTTLVHADGSKTVTVYTDGRITARHGADGSLVDAIEYDDHGNVASQTVHHPGGSFTEDFGYDALGRPTHAFRNDTQLVARYEYNAFGERTVTQGQYETGAPNGIQTRTSMAYQAGRTVTTISTHAAAALPAITREVVTAYPDGRPEKVERMDEAGALVTVRTYTYGTWEEGRTETIHFYDTDETPEQWTTNHYRMGVLVKTATPAGTTEHFFDSAGRIIRTTDADGVSALRKYDAQGRLEYTGIDNDGSTYLSTAGDLDRVSRRTVGYEVEAAHLVRVDTDSTWFGPGTGPGEGWQVVRITRTRGNGTLAKEITGGSILVRSVERAPMNDAPTGTTTGWHTLEMLPDTSRRMTVTERGYETAVASHLAKTPITVNDTWDDYDPIHHTLYEYDAEGRLWKAIDSRTGTTTRTYAPTGERTIASPHPEGGSTVTTVVLDEPHLRKRTVTLPDATVQTTEYTRDGRVRSRSGSQTYPVDYAYDRQGRMLSMTTQGHAGAATTEWLRDASGRLSEKRYEAFDEDGDGTDEPSRSVLYTYTPGGRLATRTWGRGRVTTYHHHPGTGDLGYIDYDGTDTPDVAILRDLGGRVTRVDEGQLNASPVVSTYAIWTDDNGDAFISLPDQGGPIVVENTGDPNMDGQQATFGWWPYFYYGSYGYDYMYKLDGTYAPNSWYSMEYYLDVFDATGAVHTYRYKDENRHRRVTDETIDNLLPFGESATMTREYNASSGSPTRFELVHDDPADPELAIDYAYGENGRLSSLVASYHTLPYYETVPGSGLRTDTFVYEHDTLGNGFLPSRIAGPVAETVYAWHDGADTFASVATSSLGYAGTITVAPHPISTHDYGVNSLGQRERIDVRFHQHADFGRRTGFLYDGMGQVGAANASELDLAGTPGPADDPTNRQYAFDEIGNRVWAAAGLPAAASAPAGTDPEPAPDPAQSSEFVDGYTPTLANTYTDTTRTTLGSGTTVTRKFDADGNLIFDGHFSYEYDGENRLVAFYPGESLDGSGNPLQANSQTDDFHLRFAYDYRSRRAARERTRFNGTTWVFDVVQRFVYDGWNPVFVRQQNTDLMGGPPAYWSDGVWVWGQDLGGFSGAQGRPSLQAAGGVGGLLAASVPWHYSPQSAAVHLPVYHAYDGNGNVSAVVNAVASGEAHYRYDAFGNATARLVNGSWLHHYPLVDQPFTFSTKWRESTRKLSTDTSVPAPAVPDDPEIPVTDARHQALHYYGFRYLDTQTGKWLSRDPIEERGGENIYSFVNNDPLLRVDVLGRQPGLSSPIPGHEAYNNALQEYLQRRRPTPPTSVVEDEDGNLRTQVNSCNIVIFIGHNDTVPQGRIHNEPNSAAGVFACGGGRRRDGTRIDPGVADVSFPGAPRACRPGQNISTYEVIRRFDGVFESAKKHAKTICKESKGKEPCCTTVKVSVDCSGLDSGYTNFLTGPLHTQCKKEHIEKCEQ